MNSRVAISALFILIAAMVVASQGPGLVEKFKLLEASCATKISDLRVLPILDHPGTDGNPLCAAGTLSSDAQVITFNLPNTTHLLGPQARHLQRFLLSLIHSDHQGE